MSDLKTLFKVPGKFSYGIKAFVVVLLIFLMLIPLLMVQGIADERESRSMLIRDELITSAGGEVVLSGPVLAIPAFSRKSNGDKLYSTVIVLPDELNIAGDFKTSTRNRGIYSVPVYSGALTVAAVFTIDEKVILGNLRYSGIELMLDDASLCFELPDMRALRDTPMAHIAGKEPVRMRSGPQVLGCFSSSMSVSVHEVRGRVPLSIAMSIGGGESLSFLPVGDSCKVSISSDWPSPSFNGYLLPLERSFDSTGFKALWVSTESARAFQKTFVSSEAGSLNASERQFGVRFFQPVDAYQKTTRALKYGTLFLIAPFAILFLFEIFLKTKIHPIQYLFVGLTDAVFYLLVLSISEHASFSLAYWLAAIAVMILLVSYTGSAIKNFRKSIVMVPIMASTYIYLFAALQSEDYALLIGAVGIFVSLAFVMIATRRVNWYGESAITSG